MRFCNQCGYENSGMGMFCENCGNCLAPEKPVNKSDENRLMGNQNVIAGDVSNTVYNNTTVVDNSDAKTTISCAVCGKLLAKGSGQVYRCSSCGQFVCAEHIVHEKHICKSCHTRIQAEENIAIFEYKKQGAEKYVITKLLDASALDVAVPENVVAIADGVFEGSNVVRVSLPEGLISIGRAAFKNCKRLKQINLPESLFYIEDEAFYGCERLEIEFPASIETGEKVIFGTILHQRAEAKRLAEEETRRKEQEERLRLEEARRLAAEARRREEEAKRQMEKARRREEEKRRSEAERRRAEEEARRKAEEQKRREEAERKRRDHIAKLTSYRNKIKAASSYIAAGGGHSVGLCADGSILTTGQCSVPSWTDIVSVHAGGEHTVGVKKDGTVVITKSLVDSKMDYSLSDWKNITAVSVAMDYTVGLKSDGTVVNAGAESMGAFSVPNWTNISAVAAGPRHIIGLKNDGTVVATDFRYFDNNARTFLDKGQCNTGGWAEIVAISTNAYHTVGLKQDGKVVAVGNNDFGQCNVSKWTDIVAICAGFQYTIGLKLDGTVVSTGANDCGQCNVAGWSNIVAISAGGSHTIGLKADGTVVATGLNETGACKTRNWKLFNSLDTLAQEQEKARAGIAKKLETLKQARKIAKKMIAAGKAHSLCVGVDGTVAVTCKQAGLVLYRSYWNYFGECDVSGWTDIVEICAGISCTLGLKADGTVRVTPAGYVNYVLDQKRRYKDLDKWTDIVAVTTMSKQLGDTVVGLKDDGTVVAMSVWGDKDSSMDDWRDIVAISGKEHVLGLKSNGTAVAIGSNSCGQCDVMKWGDIAAISAGGAHTVGLKTDGTVVAVGDNRYGQCNVFDWTDIVDISAGNNYTVGVRSDGTVVAVGDNSSGQCNVCNWENVLAVSAGAKHTVGLQSDGVVVAVGDDFDNQCDTKDWKLFDSADALVREWAENQEIWKQQRKTARIEKERQAEAARIEKERQEEAARIEKERQEKAARLEKERIKKEWQARLPSDLGGIANLSKRIASGDRHVAGLFPDGTVSVVDGYGRDLHVGGWFGIVEISMYGKHIVGLKADGTVVASHKYEFWQCDVSNWENIKAICTGKVYTAGIKNDGTVIVTKHNTINSMEAREKTVSVDLDWKDIVAISIADKYVVGLKADGTVVATDNYPKEVDDWTGIVAISAVGTDIVGLKTDGTVVSTGNRYFPDCAGIMDIRGESALRADGTVFIRGDDKEISDVVALGGSIYLKSDGSVECLMGLKKVTKKWQLLRGAQISKRKGLQDHMEIAKRLEEEKEELIRKKENVKGLFAQKKKIELEAQIINLDYEINYYKAW